MYLLVLAALASASAPVAADREPDPERAYVGPTAIPDVGGAPPRAGPPRPVARVELAGGHVDPRGPYRMPVIGGSLLMQVPVVALGSPNQSESMMLWTARVHAGSRALAALATFAAGPLSFPSGSIAEQQRGDLIEGGVGVRWLPLQHRVVKLGPWVAALFDRTRVDLELDDGDRRLRGRKLQWEALLEIGLELDLTLVPQSPTMPVRIDGVVATALRMAAPLGTRLEIDDGASVSTMEHAPDQLRTLEPFGGAAATLVFGIQVQHDLALRRISPESVSRPGRTSRRCDPCGLRGSARRGARPTG